MYVMLKRVFEMKEDTVITLCLVTVLMSNGLFWLLIGSLVGVYGWYWLTLVFLVFVLSFLVVLYTVRLLRK
jgi:uncharacterized membrane protein